jgi:hypothetical protein
MKLFVIHDRKGTISAAVTAPDDAPMPALTNAQPGQMTSEVDAPGVSLDPTGERGDEQLLRLLGEYRVEVTGETRLVPKRDEAE